MTILDKIIENKRKEVSLISRSTSVKDLENSKFFNRCTISLSESLLNRNKSGIIAEFKRKSPSKGVINSFSLVEEVTSGYFREGASGISVLTDYRFSVVPILIFPRFVKKAVSRFYVKILLLMNTR